MPNERPAVKLPRLLNLCLQFGQYFNNRSFVEKQVDFFFYFFFYFLFLRRARTFWPQNHISMGFMGKSSWSHSKAELSDGPRHPMAPAHRSQLCSPPLKLHFQRCQIWLTSETPGTEPWSWSRHVFPVSHCFLILFTTSGMSTRHRLLSPSTTTEKRKTCSSTQVWQEWNSLKLHQCFWVFSPKMQSLDIFKATKHSGVVVCVLRGEKYLNSSKCLEWIIKFTLNNRGFPCRDS